MARPTHLKVLGDRPIPIDLHGQPDERPVDEAFPAAGPHSDPTHDPIGQDILELIRKSNERMTGEAERATSAATQASHIATEAINRVDAVAAQITSLPERMGEAEAKVTFVTERALAAIAQSDETNKAIAGAKAATAVIAAQKIGERLAAALTSSLDRIPALMTLGSAVWLWRGVLDNPSWLQLGALGLFGACAIAPAVWLSARKH